MVPNSPFLPKQRLYDCLAVKAGKMHFLHHSAHLPVLLLQSLRLLGHLVIKPSRHDLRGMSDPKADRFPPLSPNRWWFWVSGYYSWPSQASPSLSTPSEIDVTRLPGPHTSATRTRASTVTSPTQPTQASAVVVACGFCKPHLSLSLCDQS